ncbi:low molecular weight protein arginine phosphatase [Filibacter tadaridae]|uniref:Low molecular weight protein-tyrosine-phosphatase YwlE n=1 Tax=Filibacter tadaridae TaxID=2483811 RepID=A0A3P5WTZ0_9BACL|nr:Low molecular weight protein-tyrosine-phosphatase YwlE [Filibacter tadaridae]
MRAKDNMEIKVRSAGLHASPGIPISSYSKRLIEEAGMPYSPLSRRISSEDIEWADLILTMTEGHKYALLQLYPEVLQKAFTLREYVQLDERKDVQDPFGGDIELYRHAFRELTANIDVLERKLMEH